MLVFYNNYLYIHICLIWSYKYTTTAQEHSNDQNRISHIVSHIQPHSGRNSLFLRNLDIVTAVQNPALSIPRHFHKETFGTRGLTQNWRIKQKPIFGAVYVVFIENLGRLHGEENGQHVRPAKRKDDDCICGRRQRAAKNCVGRSTHQWNTATTAWDERVLLHREIRRLLQHSWHAGKQVTSNRDRALILMKWIL